MCLLWTRASQTDPLPLQFWNKPYSPSNLGACWYLILSWPHRGVQCGQLGIFQSCNLQLLQSGEGRGSLQAEASWQKLGLGCLRSGIYFPLRSTSLNWDRGFSPGLTVSRNKKKDTLRNCKAFQQPSPLNLDDEERQEVAGKCPQVGTGLSRDTHPSRQGLGADNWRLPGSP